MIDRLLSRGVEERIFSLTTLCDLHKPCINNMCAFSSKLNIIDFDKTKDWFCKKYEYKPFKSVDALLMKQDTICFIEIKGWAKFIEYNKSIAKQSVEQKLDDFNLDAKYVDSYRILNNLVDNKLFDFNSSERASFYSKKKYFVLVTDITSTSSPINFIATGLNFLANSSSTKLCYNITNDYLSNFVTSSKELANPIKQVLIYCKDFDSKISELFDCE